MADNTKIEWTDATWNPTTGCDKVSPGCDNCYAMTLAPRLKAMGSAHYQTDGDPTTSGPGFGFAMHPDALDKPLKWKRGRRIFVNSMSDLFHSDMSTDFLADVFAVMSMAPQHTFQVLTKRPGVMRSVLRNPMFKLQVNVARMRRGVSVLPDSRRDDGTYAWPLPNLWLGTSIENQDLDWRLSHLLDTPAAVRYLSLEPLLGPLNLIPPLKRFYKDGPVQLNQELHWVIVGGESGRGARPMHPAWARSLRDQCTDAGIAFHFKQWGSWSPQPWGTGVDGDLVLFRDGSDDPWLPGDNELENKYNGALMRRSSKQIAGRVLDGCTWDEFPQLEGAAR